MASNIVQELVETAYIRTKALRVGIMAVEQNARHRRGMARIGRCHSKTYRKVNSQEKLQLFLQNPLPKRKSYTIIIMWLEEL